MPAARADTLSNYQSQAAAINAKITSLGYQEDALSEQYDGAVQALADANAKVASATAALASAQAGESKAREVLQADAIDAYVNGGSQLTNMGVSAEPLSSANEALVRQEFVNSVASTESDAMNQFKVAADTAATARQTLSAARDQSQQAVNKLASARSQVLATKNQLVAAESQVQGKIATITAQIKAEQEHQAELAAQAAAAAAAAAAAQQSTGGGGGVSFSVPQGGGSRSFAAAAVRAAESRVGDPYVWAASGPNAFDCSGLVMWAYSQAGIHLPHYSGAQYADTTHIPMSDLQPGDLVFPSNPGEHVAMYVGGGMIVEAPYTGAYVHVIPLSSFFVLASRVE